MMKSDWICWPFIYPQKEIFTNKIESGLNGGGSASIQSL